MMRSYVVACVAAGLGAAVSVSALAADVGGPVPAIPVSIQAAQTNAAVNPFIYGQFIEHLGRCVYGGIWAEMLEDRKFYFPVTASYAPYRSLQETPFPVVGASPWELLGPAESVRMDTADAFVGRHSPVLAPGSGIRQNDLGVRQGRKYVGYVWLKAGGKGVTVDAALAWGPDGADRERVRIARVGTDYRRYTLAFTAGADTDKAAFELRVSGGPCHVGTASLMPADNVRGLRADTLRLLKQLDSPMYRWPGGNFVSGYEWRDGIGDRDRRPPRKNPAWTGVEHNDFGLDEFIDFCREVRAEPLVTVNTGFGDAHSAAAEVAYCNAPASSAAGAERARNGNRAPYAVKYWCVGNEMFGPWQLGFMQLHHYTLKHSQVAEAMWRADPSILLVGVGDLGTLNAKHDPNEKRRWSAGMLEQCAGDMNYLSEHFYRGRSKDGVAAHVRQIPDAIREKAEGIRKLHAELPSLKGRRIPIAMDEWNYWHRPYVYGELGCEYDLADALGIAAGLHEYFRQTDIIHMASYAQTVNVIGCIKTTRTDAFLDTTALPLILYRREFGTIPVAVAVDGAPAGIDVAAALTADRKALTVAVVNANAEPRALRLAVHGAAPGAEGALWEIAGDDPGLKNGPGAARVAIRERKAAFDGNPTVPAFSVSLWRVPVR